MKLILALLWQLIVRYQIGLLRMRQKEWIIAWLRAVIPELNISNLTTDWNNGLALFALIDFCEPGSCTHWRTLNPHNKLANCKQGMLLAHSLFKIPMVLHPEDLASPDLDELSCITLYLSVLSLPLSFAHYLSLYFSSFLSFSLYLTLSFFLSLFLRHPFFRSLYISYFRSLSIFHSSFHSLFSHRLLPSHCLSLTSAFLSVSLTRCFTLFTPSLL
ncbi:FLNA [Acanthosepion pharaonis]|uniref:FLNA n=1 Tax=Acanthosepion pharaonis TaxID=158019 RepID=A0A812DTV3_ACAPH|nr:FLNA [Sepia pharaonis]